MKVRCSPARTEKALFLGDIHVPYHDPVAVELALAFAKWFSPQTVFLIGDILHFDAVSKYDKPPDLALKLQEDIDAGKALLQRVRKVAPKARLVFLSGNHENRLVRHLWQHPALFNLTSLQLPALLGLDKLKIEYHGYHEQVWWHDLLVEHGDLVRKGSGATARGMLERRGVSGICGHCHRLATVAKTDHSGTKHWTENGCLALLNPSYAIGAVDWQQGFSIGLFPKGGGRTRVETVPILDGRAHYGGNVWKA